MLCSVVKHLGRGKALKKIGKNTRLRLVFSPRLFRALPLPPCFATEQSTVEASLFVNKHDHNILFYRKTTGKRAVLSLV